MGDQHDDGELGGTRAAVAVLAVALLVAAGCGSPEPGTTTPNTVTPTTVAPVTVTPGATERETSGTAAVSFGDVTVEAAVTRCALDPDAEPPPDGSPATVLTVIASGPGPDGTPWEVQVVRTLAGPHAIDTVRVHPDRAPPVDRYEAQRVVDTDRQEVDDLWGDSTNALLVTVVNGTTLEVTPPDTVTFGVYPADPDADAAVAGTGTFAVTCELPADR